MIIINKFLKKSFGSNNFSNSKPSNGVYVRLVAASLSKKGNWGTIFRKFVNFSLNSRRLGLFNLNHSVDSKLPVLLFQQSSWTKKNVFVFRKFLSPLLGSLDQQLKTLNNRLVILSSTIGAKKYLPDLTSLRNIYSIFHPVAISIELKSKRRGGRVFSVPIPVKSDRRRHSIFIRWFKKSLVENSYSSLDRRLFEELNQLGTGHGKSIERLVELDKAIKINRVFLRKSQIRLV